MTSEVLRAHTVRIGVGPAARQHRSAAMTQSQRRLETMTWPELQRQAARPGSTVIWPFGAFEQHGPHLPLSTDALFADRITDAVLAELDPGLPIWRLPLQHLGFSPEHQGFAGTLSLPAELLISLVVNVGRQLELAGFRRLVLLNGHGGQIGLLEVAGRTLRSHHPRLAVLPCFLWRGPEGIDELIPEPERSQGLHAGLAETSLMLHLAPELTGSMRPSDGPHAVIRPIDGATGAMRAGDQAGAPLDPRSAEARRAAGLPPEGWSLEGLAPCCWITSEFSASGVIGSAEGASAELGERLYQRLVEGWRRRLDALLRSDWPPTSGAG